MIDTNFFEEPNHIIVGSEGINVAIKDFEQVRNDNGLE